MHVIRICKTTVANHRSKNAPLRHESPENFNCLTHVNLPYEFFFQKNFQPAIVYSIRSHSVKFIRNASYINRKGLSCLPQLSKQIIQWKLISRLKKTIHRITCGLIWGLICSKFAN